jgi:hypothetical protein
MAAERLDVPLLFYADYPYVLTEENQSLFEKPAPFHAPISDFGLKAWQMAVAAHQSQISTFWQNLDEMRLAIQEYCQRMNGIKLFK